MDQDRLVYIVVDRVGAPYQVLLYQSSIRFSLLTNSKVLSLQQQGSTFLSTLYLLSIFHIFEKRLKNLKIPVSLIYFVDDRLSISQNTSLIVSNSQLFCSCYIISSLLR